MTLTVPEELRTRAARTTDALVRTDAALRSFALTDRHAALTIFATGSLGRGEGARSSDLDVFLVDTATVTDARLGRLDTIQVQADLIRAANAAGFPPFSRDGEFLQVHVLSALLEKLGRPDEDALNVFTARMLLLLESVCLAGETPYARSIETVLDRYWAEADDRDDFRPTFLINDIVRYWKTLCLSYEGWRDRPGRRLDADGRIDLLKLKFNRLWLCFNGLAFLLLGDEAGRYARAHGLRLTQLKPIERMVEVAARHKELVRPGQEALDGYAWWLERSGAEKDEVRRWIEDDVAYEEASDIARSFGDVMHMIVTRLAERAGLTRYLLV
jgi:hypothetical protein